MQNISQKELQQLVQDTRKTSECETTKAQQTNIPIPVMCHTERMNKVQPIPVTISQDVYCVVQPSNIHMAARRSDNTSMKGTLLQKVLEMRKEELVKQCSVYEKEVMEAFRKNPFSSCVYIARNKDTIIHNELVQYFTEAGFNAEIIRGDDDTCVQLSIPPDNTPNTNFKINF